jgi:hypothetical protein
MKKNYKMLLHTARFFLALALIAIATSAYSKKDARYYYQIKVYHLKTAEQETKLDTYLQNAYLPALHRAGIPSAGVFKPIEKDTEQVVYVFVPFSTWKQYEELDGKLDKDAQYQADGKEYIDAAYTNIPYRRIETILLKAFELAPVPTAPQLTAAKADRVYEMRSYEGPTEKLHKNKVQMFNKGDEVGLFKRLGFNAVFYSEVIAGSTMPNLMYMTTFNSKADRDEHWKAFGDDAYWKVLVAKPEYQHNVSKAVITLLRPTDYSDY